MNFVTHADDREKVAGLSLGSVSVIIEEVWGGEGNFELEDGYTPSTGFGVVFPHNI